MNFKVGDVVSRNSHDNDIMFRILEINEGVAILKGVDLRLYADSDVLDLKKEDNVDSSKDDRLIIDANKKDFNLDRSQYFYIPGTILHIDGDQDYLERCLNFYKDIKVKAYGVNLNEKVMAKEIGNYLEKYRPDIVVITGHDAYYKRKNDMDDINNYQNSQNFVNTIKAARKFEKSQDKLIIIAGACQSNYEQLIKSGANFASSPKRINIHALDPAIIASSVALSLKNESIDLINMIEKTKYGSNGIGGIITNGTMYVGFPR